MASGDIDQRVLGHLAAHASHENPLLSSALYQVLGLSTVLATKLCRANRLRRLDPSRQTRSLDLYHQIIWMSKEGLAMTEVFILPYCQDPESGREYRVMAARLRASFFHVFSLFHNHPPVTQLRLIGEESQAEPPRRGVLRDSIPSYHSESSYITNPYASPPTVHVIPPLPMSPPRKAPAYPPGLEMTQDYNPPVLSAAYIMPVEDYTIPTRKYFETALTLADTLLEPTHPLRLSVTLEYATFLYECLGYTDTPQKLCKHAIRAAYADEKHCSDARFEEATTLVMELARLAQRIEAVVAERNRRQAEGEEAGVSYAADHGAHNGHAHIETMTDSPLQYSTFPPAYPPPTRELPAPPHQSDQTHTALPAVLARGPISPPPNRALPELPKQAKGLGISHLTESEGGSTGMGSIGTTILKPYPMVPNGSNNKDKQTNSRGEHTGVEEKRRKSRASSGSSRSARSRMEGSGTDKERKRRALERAEDELIRKRSTNSDTNTINTVIRRR